MFHVTKENPFLLIYGIVIVVANNHSVLLLFDKRVLHMPYLEMSETSIFLEMYRISVEHTPQKPSPRLIGTGPKENILTARF